MKRSVSQIAWPAECEEEAVERLVGLGIQGIELAPRRAFGDPEAAVERDVRERAGWYRERGLAISSFQALLFGVDGLHLLREPAARERMAEVLMAVSRVAGWCGAGAMVFGSPKNRDLGGMEMDQAVEIAVPFFQKVGDYAAACGTCLVMEANPVAYGTDFVNRLEEAGALVRAVDTPGFRVHVDAGGLSLNGEDPDTVVPMVGGLIGHVHASQPHLASWSEPDPVHAKLGRALRTAGWDGWVALEMRQQEDVWRALGVAVGEMKAAYGA